MNLLSSRAFRRSTAFAWHLVGLFASYAMAFALRFDFAIPEQHRDTFWEFLPWYIGVFLALILVFRLYRGLWSYFSFSDALRHALVFALGSAICLGIVYFSREGSFNRFPRSIFLTHFLLLLAWEIGGRAIVRLIRQLQTDYLVRNGGPRQGGERSVVVGSLAEADQFIRAFRSNTATFGQVVAVVTGDDIPARATIHGARVHGGLDSIPEVLEQTGAETLMILPPANTPRQMARIVDDCAEKGVSCQYRVIPSVGDLASGKLDVSALREVQIEDLLHREPNQFDRKVVERFLDGKTVLVTGAGGSIGSEICRQVAERRIKRLVLFEQSEFALFQIDGELRNAHPGLDLVPVTGDVRRKETVLRAIADAGGVDVVYHAAAYKHVHLMEKNVPSAFHNNVLGSAAAAEAAAESGVSKFIMISTDKAVRPTSVMGASKRIAERAVLERAGEETGFVAVRFGNVLGSSGSVIPIFTKQIAEGGPVTVTTPETRRFFMTIPEAVELVLMAGTVGDHGDIMALQMGEQVKIVDLARRLIELSGLRVGDDIEIEYIGLRQGEKEYEELLTEDENVERTEHEKIWVMRKNSQTPTASPVGLDRIRSLVEAGDSQGLRDLASELVGEHHLGSDGTEGLAEPAPSGLAGLRP